MILLKYIISGYFTAENSSVASYVTQVKFIGHHTVASKAVHPGVQIPICPLLHSPARSLCPDTLTYLLLLEKLKDIHTLEPCVLFPLPGIAAPSLVSGLHSNKPPSERISLFTDRK